MSTSLGDNSVMANEDEHGVLGRIEHALKTTTAARPPKLIGPQGEQIELPESAARALCEVVHYLSRNQAIAIVPVERALTTQEAAELLNISRPYLIKLLEDGVMPFTKTGTHRRVRLHDVLAYKRRRDEERERALDRLAQLHQEMGLYDE